MRRRALLALSLSAASGGLASACGGSPNAPWDPPIGGREPLGSEERLGPEPRSTATVPPGASSDDVAVAMYMTSWCPVCRRARAWLERQGVPFVEHDVETDARAARLMRSLNPRGAVPMFDVDGRILIGFSPPMLRQALELAEQERRDGP
jgi:glutaredoxin